MYMLERCERKDYGNKSPDVHYSQFRVALVKVPELFTDVSRCEYKINAMIHVMIAKNISHALLMRQHNCKKKYIVVMSTT